MKIPPCKSRLIQHHLTLRFLSSRHTAVYAVLPCSSGYIVLLAFLLSLVPTIYGYNIHSYRRPACGRPPVPTCGKKYIASPAGPRSSMIRCIVDTTYVTTISRTDHLELPYRFWYGKRHTQTVALLSMHVPRGRRADGLPRSTMSTSYQTPGTNLTGRSH